MSAPPVRLELVHALRERAAAFVRDALVVVRVEGQDAWDVLDRLLPCELYLREGQLQPTLLLREDGTIAADLTVGAGEEDFWILAEGMSEEALLTRLRAEVGPGEDVVFVGLSDTYQAVGVEGPYAWQVLEEAGHQGVSRLPFHTFYTQPSGLWVGRTGRTGEYGFLYLVPHQEVEGFLAGLSDTPLAGPAELAHCTVEAFGFDIHHPALAELDPLALQLQWRLNRRKTEVVGMAALQERLRDPQRRRIVGLTGPANLATGDALLLDGEVVGQVLTAVPWLGEAGGSIGMGLLPLPLSHPGLDALTSPRGPIRTTSPPFFVARSFRLKPSPRAPEPASLPPPYA